MHLLTSAVPKVNIPIPLIPHQFLQAGSNVTTITLSHHDALGKSLSFVKHLDLNKNDHYSISTLVHIRYQSIPELQQLLKNRYQQCLYAVYAQQAQERLHELKIQHTKTSCLLCCYTYYSASLFPSV